MATLAVTIPAIALALSVGSDFMPQLDEGAFLLQTVMPPDTSLEEVDRVPSCVRTCPANARHYGDLADPESNVSIMVAERGGIDLMPEQGTRPVNKYLPPRPRKPLAAPALLAEESDGARGFFAWLDGVLERL